ncbi:MAG: hypothetical protein OQJ97_03395 [Rhodospirillales bacterium]|nr:hypothetical protein [Rhodospirillales bacterium]
MGIFDILSEAKIMDWLKRKEEPDYQPPPKVEKTELGESAESYMLGDIKALIKEAYEATDETERHKILAKANNLEIQLSASFEMAGYNLLAKRTQETIREYKKEVSKSLSKKNSD